MKQLAKNIIAVSIFLGSQIKAFAYNIPSEYRPENMPFGFTSDKIEAGEGAVGGIILILQVVEGGLLYFAAPMAVIMIAYAGLLMIITGTSEGYATGKKSIMWAFLGLIVIILSYSIVRITITLILEFGA